MSDLSGLVFESEMVEGVVDSIDPELFFRNGSDVVEFGFFLETVIKNCLSELDGVDVLSCVPRADIKNYTIKKSFSGADVVYKKTRGKKPFTDIDVLFSVEGCDGSKVYWGEVKSNKYGGFVKRVSKISKIGMQIFDGDFGGVCLFAPLNSFRNSQLSRVAKKCDMFLYSDICDVVDFSRKSLQSRGYEVS